MCVYDFNGEERNQDNEIEKFNKQYDICKIVNVFLLCLFFVLSTYLFIYLFLRSKMIAEGNFWWSMNVEITKREATVKKQVDNWYKTEKGNEYDATQK